MTMVNPSKDDEILVNSPATIKSEKTDSDRDAMSPKKVRRKSRPIILVKALLDHTNDLLPPTIYHVRD